MKNDRRGIAAACLCFYVLFGGVGAATAQTPPPVPGAADATLSHPVVDQLQLQTDLTQLYRLIESEAAVTPEDRLAPGSPVRIIHGPLAGLEGKVIRRDKNCRFFIEVRLLQRAVSAEIESWMIEAV